MTPRRTVGSGPEAKIVAEWTDFLRARGWYVMKMHGSQYQAGFPDLFCTHPRYRVRLVEIKDPKRRKDPYTPAQLLVFKMLSAHGSPVWTLTTCCQSEYEKLFGPENWWTFLGVVQ